MLSAQQRWPAQDLDRYAPEPEVHKYLHSRCRSSAPGWHVAASMGTQRCSCRCAGLTRRAGTCRLMHFDWATLFELHYHLITLGKVLPVQAP